MYADVLVVGGGPAGLAAAIAASTRGLRVAVAEPRRPPIDKVCGEGLLPDAVNALQNLGVWLNTEVAYPLAGIRFLDEASSVSAALPEGTAYGLRRTRLHELLLRRAEQAGVQLLWGSRVSDFGPFWARVNGKFFSFRWLVGADGHNSAVRTWANVARRVLKPRFGFRRHYAIAPWSDHVEVYWGPGCEIIVTPVSAEEICVGLFSQDSRVRMEQALAQFPAVERLLEKAEPVNAEHGAATGLANLGRVVRGQVSLIGDASFTVDGIAGQGLSLAFKQAIQLAEALVKENLALYQAAHRKICCLPAQMTRLMLMMDRYTQLRQNVLRIFAACPALFSKMISIHTGGLCRRKAAVEEIFEGDGQVLRA